MADTDVSTTCYVYLLGSLAILDADGAVRTPKAQKARALVALLALAPRGARSRVWLRDKLWSESNEEQGGASLRQALTDVRRSLGEHADELLISDNYTVSLNLSRIYVDALDPASAGTAEGDTDSAPELLEGLDIADPEFEDWLTLERQVWRSRLDNAAVQRRLVPKTERNDKPAAAPIQPAMNGHGTPPGGSDEGWSVALVPGAISGDVAGLGALPEQFSRLLVRSLLDTGDIRVLDMSHTATPDNRAFAATALVIEPRYRITGDQVHISLALTRNQDQTLLWMGGATLDRRAIEHDDMSASHKFLNEAIDRLRSYFYERAQLSAEESRGGESLFAAINAMFRLSRGDLQKSEASLRRMIAARPSAQAYAWLSFLMTFRVGQRFSDWASTIEEAQEYGRKSLELDSSNSVALALVGHVHSFLFGEYDFASGLLERAIRANPAGPLGWDLYSMLQAYAGDPKKGLRMASWGRHLAESSPYRYYFDTSRCVTAALAGEHDIAIAAGESALHDRPDFNSLLRYLVASHAHRGDLRAAGSFLDRLHVVEPDFSIGALVDARYPVMQTEGGKHLIDGLLKAGVKK
jgi:tetratricopeptide (TPR) repeat protein